MKVRYNDRIHKVISEYSMHPNSPVSRYLLDDGEVVYIDDVTPLSTREDVLEEAKAAVLKDRNVDYGSPEQNFQVIAELWGTYLTARDIDFDLDDPTPADVAAMMILMKISRIITSPQKRDHWVDIAGYACCGDECAEKENHD